MKNLPLVSGIICAGAGLTAAAVGVAGFYYAGFSGPFFAFVGFAFVALFTLGWFFGARRVQFLEKLRTEISRIGKRTAGEADLAGTTAKDFPELSTAWVEARERIARIFSSQKDFTANAAHELRTPLAALRLTGETALRGSVREEELRETIGLMLEETARVSGLVEKLLMLARAESGRLPVEADYHKAAAIVGEVVELLRPLAEEKGQIVAPSIPEDLTLWADANLLRLVVENF